MNAFSVKPQAKGLGGGCLWLIAALWVRVALASEVCSFDYVLSSGALDSSFIDVTEKASADPAIMGQLRRADGGQ